MTVITGIALVNVGASDLAVIRIDIGLVAVRMTVDTGEHSVIRSIDVAVRTVIPRALMPSGVDGEEQPIVIEVRVIPARGVVALFAAGAETRGLMVGIVRRKVVLLVAGIARGIQAGKAPAGVALRAVQGFVRAVQREAGRGVVEAGASPQSGGMTQFAVLREVAHDVIGALGRFVVIAVTTHAFSRRIHVDKLSSG